MEIWIARDFDGGLYTFINKPWLQTVDKIWLDYPIYISIGKMIVHIMNNWIATYIQKSHLIIVQLK